MGRTQVGQAGRHRHRGTPVGGWQVRSRVDDVGAAAFGFKAAGFDFVFSCSSPVAKTSQRVPLYHCGDWTCTNSVP